MGPQIRIGNVRSTDEAYTPASLPGLGTATTFFHTQATVGFDSRLASGYARRGGFYGVTGHDYTDRDDAFGFRRVDYEAIQHFPLLRESWVISLHGLAKMSWDKGDQATPFYAKNRAILDQPRGFSSFASPTTTACCCRRVADHRQPLLRERGLL